MRLLPTIATHNVQHVTLALPSPRPPHLPRDLVMSGALSDANVTVRAGEVVALFGDNGAGKVYVSQDADRDGQTGRR